MMNYRVWTSALLLAGAGACLAQSWNGAYEAGLKTGGALKWAEARQDFKQAAAYRPEDVSGPTILPGPPTLQRRWRDGAPYSPNFLAAYSEYRLGLASVKADQQPALLNTAAGELESLLAKHQVSRLNFYILTNIYQRLGDQNRLKALQDKYGAMNASWKVDTEVVAPEELAAVQALSPTTPSEAKQVTGSNSEGTISAQNVNPTTGQPVNSTVSPLGSVAKLPNKYALVIGVNNSRLQGNLDFSGTDAIRVRDSLVNYAGYTDTNVDLLVDVPASKILARAQALAARMPEAATLCIYFSGSATNIGGVDYLGAIDSPNLVDTSHLVRKSELFAQFLPKGSHVFAFFQVDRSASSESAFGSEQTFLGSISQMQATTTGDPVFSTYRNGKLTGLFTDAFTQTLLDLQSNRVPILEFGWQLFYHIRRGDTGLSGGSSHQTPTLPHLNNLASDAQF
jgi:hypothetical protein